MTLESLAAGKWFRRAERLDGVVFVLVAIALMVTVTGLSAWLLLPNVLTALGLPGIGFRAGTPELSLVVKTVAAAWGPVMVTNFVQSDFRMRAVRPFQQAVQADIAVRYGIRVRSFNVPVTPDLSHTVTVQHGGERTRVILVFRTPWSPIVVQPVDAVVSA